MLSFFPLNQIQFRTGVNENVSLQVIAASESAVAVIADEVLLHFGKRTIPVLVHHNSLGDINKGHHTRGSSSRGSGCAEPH